MNTKLVVAIVIIIVLAAGGYFLWDTKEEEPSGPSINDPIVDPNPLETYSSSTLGFSVKYPKSFRLVSPYAYDQFGPNKLIHGVKFLIPESMATGTNLSSFDTGVSIEILPRARNCTGDIYLLANVSAAEITEGNVKYSFATSMGAAAGNQYEEMVYAIASSSPCTAVRYFIHSGNIGNYPEGAVREFDREALMQEFHKIRQSLILE